MQNFEYHNPVRLVFGKNTIPQLAQLVSPDARVLMAYGGGSIKRNGVYDQVMAALGGREVVEFGGIEPNPRYETLMKAVEQVRARQLDFLLAVGGGSVLDGVKFIAAAAPFTDGDPWTICSEWREVKEAVPLGCVLTLPATGSEMNMFSVVSRESTREKLNFASPLVMPRFSVLDPETTYTLPEKQSRNGVVDAFVHVMEQYATYPAAAPLQDRQAEAILLTLIEEGPKVLTTPEDYDTRATVMWAATNALNGLISCGAPQDWATHAIGHEITALWGIDHAETLAMVLPALLRFKREAKGEKLVQYGQRVWGIDGGDDLIEAAIARTEQFFRDLGMRTRLAECGITEGIEQVGQRLSARGANLGEHQDITGAEVNSILELCRE